MDEDRPKGPLRQGWTTGACAAAAAKAAFTALLTGRFPDPVSITLPKGQKPAFPLATESLSGTAATAGIVKDAGDDPDVTHGALILVTVTRAAPGTGVAFCAGEGVGTVTKPGLPVPVGEPAINPMPRQMILSAIREVARQHGAGADAVVTVAVPGGEALARRTLNPRLGIVGGLSILGTTGIVIPYSCSAWIHSIHRGIDVARALGLPHIAGATGAVSEAAVARLHGLPESALIEMGDFVGGMLKYLRSHPVPRVTVAGGFAKMCKLAQGLADLHSRAGPVDLRVLAEALAEAGASPGLVSEAAQADSAAQVLALAEAGRLPVADIIAGRALAAARRLLAGSPVAVDVALFDRDGRLLAEAG